MTIHYPKAFKQTTPGGQVKQADHDFGGFENTLSGFQNNKINKKQGVNAIYGFSSMAHNDGHVHNDGHAHNDDDARSKPISNPALVVGLGSGIGNAVDRKFGGSSAADREPIEVTDDDDAG